ncbi:FadR/GntR family transcriptional regulator [Aquabacterium sp. OR-4]|uniref:FadR/GntR family transcriptional regulator n=1 Tax=Aquabacterium sp. OR-4 TaxID=2978127 RepID=UPI0021B1D93E|nr:FadR/GntR family transcriptional regulator [Aquabacterium sp. OR-4]MDT7838457.1 FadR/GntR family transcriptional regulator [Aquabacterium sp. OR-4]
MNAIKNVLGHTLDLLGEAIVSGRYGHVGSIPPEAQLCTELGVSRTVVREAIKSLVAKGLVTTGPKVGTRVLPADQWNWFDPSVVAWQSRIGLTREFLRDLQELRRIVEPAAVRMAAERATPADIAEIETAYAGMKAAIELGGDYVAHDLRFHQGLLHACHNRMMVQMGKALGALLRTSFEISTSRPDGPAQSLPLHRAVLDALIARDADRAERASLLQIDGAQEDIEQVLGSPRRKLPSLALPAPPLKAPRSPKPARPAAPAKTAKTSKPTKPSQTLT